MISDGRFQDFFVCKNGPFCRVPEVSIEGPQPVPDLKDTLHVPNPLGTDDSIRKRRLTVVPW